MLEEMMGLESHQEESDDYVHVLIEIIWVCSCLFADASGYLQVGDCWGADKPEGSATKVLG